MTYKNYLDKEMVAIPLISRGKSPTINDWQNVNLETWNLEDAFSHDSNVGLVLGDASGGLVDIDLDCAEAILVAPYFLPDTPFKFGRQSAPASHWVYRVENPGKREVFKAPNGNMLVEYRGNGGQTMVPPSIHPSGEEVSFTQNDGDVIPTPACAEKDNLLKQIGRLAAASLLVRNWVEGSRHDIALALAGGLCRAGWNENEVRHFLKAVCHAARDPESDSRLNDIRTTYQQHAVGEKTTGWPSLSELVGQDAVDCVMKWLGIEKTLQSEFRNEWAAHLFTGFDPSVGLGSDVHNAKLFVYRQHGDVIWVPQQKSWYCWDGTRWRADATIQIGKKAQETAENAGSLFDEIGLALDNDKRMNWQKGLLDRRRLDNMIELAKPHLAKSVYELDNRPCDLNCLNGTLDLKTGELRPHKRSDFITQLADVEYDPGATCPVFDTFLERISDGDPDWVSYILRVGGYSLFSGNPEHVVFIGYGTGANGKSVLLNTWRDLLGDYASQINAETLLEKAGGNNGGPRSDIVRLAGIRFISASESEAGRALAEGQLKAITGGDPVVARGLYEKEIEFTPDFKIFLATNHKPRIKGTDEGIWRRMQLIPFRTFIPESERDKQLPEKLAAERSGILNRLLEGYSDYVADGLNPPECVREATKAYRSEMDILEQFLDECTVEESGGRTTKATLYATYKHWCEENGYNPYAKGRFGSRLKEHGFREGASGERYWADIRLAGRHGPVNTAMPSNRSIDESEHVR